MASATAGASRAAASPATSSSRSGAARPSHRYRRLRRSGWARTRAAWTSNHWTTSTNAKSPRGWNRPRPSPVSENDEPRNDRLCHVGVPEQQCGGRDTMNAAASITITPVRVADLLAEGERMPVYVHVIDHPDARVLVDAGMTDLHPAVADLDPRLHPLSKQNFDLAGIDIVVNTHLHFDHCGGNH